jgi:hypothetical protein
MQVLRWKFFLLFLMWKDMANGNQNEMQARPCCENGVMPPTILFSIYMGKIKYNYFPLTVESMRLNTAVTFVIINIIEDDKDQSSSTQKILDAADAPNIVLKVLTITQWKDVITRRLGVDIPFTTDWYYKLCDYKPALAYLFPELLDSRPYQFWGYADLDLVWGSFSRFAHLFQGDYYFIKPHWHDVVGMAQFFRNEEFSVSLFKTDPFYVTLLANKTYHNLDETGGYTPPAQQQYKASSMNAIVHRLSKQRDPKTGQLMYRLNRGQHPKDNIHIEMKIIYLNQDVPVVSWVAGHLRVVHRRLGFEAGRDILFAHRMLNIPFPQLPPDRRREVLEDMETYGFLLPNWVPLLTRHMCRQHYKASASPHNQLYDYYPYDANCFGKE